MSIENNNHPIIFTQTYRIDTTMIDFNQQLALDKLLGLMQDMATEHASLLGLDYDSLLEKGFFWVLIQQHLKLWKKPHWNDCISINTWVSKMTGIYAIREFEIFLNEEKIAECSLTCMILDSQTHRPKRISGDTYLPLTRKDNNLDFKAEKIRLPKTTPEKSKTIQVNISDLDMNQHVNNVRYSCWFLDSLSLDDYQNHIICDYQINFSGETFLADTIDCFAYMESETNSSDLPIHEAGKQIRYFSGVRQNDGKTVFTIRAELQKI